MSNRPGATHGTVTATSAPPRRATIPVYAVAAAVSALTFALVIGPVGRLPRFGPLSVNVIALTIAFAASEIFLIHIETRRDAVSLSLSTIPLVVGLYAVDPVMLVVARVAGSAIALILHRRQSPMKLFVNLAQMGLEAATMVLVFRAFAPAGDIGPRSWPAAGIATVAGDFVQTGVLVAAISLYQRQWQVDLSESMLIGSAARLIDTALALVVVSVLVSNPAAIALLLPACVVLVWAYRTHTALRDQHRQLEDLHSFTRAMGDAVLEEHTVESLLRESSELLHADAAWVFLRGADGSLRSVAWRDDSISSIETVVPGSVGEGIFEKAGRHGGCFLIDVAAEPALAELDVHQAMVVELRSGSDTAGVLVVADRSGELRTFGPDDVRLLEMLAAQGGVALANGQLVDRLKVHAAEKEYQSLHDPLTGLPNRAMFSRRVEERLSVLAAGRGAAAAVLLLDLDGFKDVNDTLGHHYGDELLRYVALRLVGALRFGDTVARLGGDEFAVLLPDVAGIECAVSVAHGLLAALATPFAVADVTVDVRASIGIVLAPEHAGDAAGLIQRADVAMYVAKEGLSGVEVYDVARDGHTPERLALVGELRQAIADHGLDVHYQPQVDLATGAVVGAEALVRWNHPTHGPIPPDEFVPVAERTGLVGPLTTYVLDTAVRACAGWRAAGGPPRVSVNISARSLLHASFVDDVAAVLRTHGLPPAALCLELTETTIMVDPRRTVTMLQRLAGIGVTVAIDDFGTGHSSLAYLKALPVGEIKIDKSFVMSMTASASDEAIVCSIIQLAANLDLPVVAEGVESAAIAGRLRALGCATGQGYGFSRAVPDDAFVAWVDAWRGANRAGRTAAASPTTTDGLVVAHR